MKTQPQAVLINDLSSFGRCSLSVWMPILSAFGDECLMLPTSVLSSHTAYKGFILHDLAQEIDPFIEHWKTLEIRPRLIMSGYIANAEQGDKVLHAIEALRDEDTIVCVDPAMADDGRLYPGLDQAVVEKMREIVAQADYIFPNLTEACLLCETEMSLDGSREYTDILAEKLHAMGPKGVVMTGLITPDKVGCISYDFKNGPRAFYNERVEPFRHGTGDLYSAICSGLIQLNVPLEQAARKAGEFVHDAMKLGNEYGTDWREGVPFEYMLGRVIDWRKEFEPDTSSK